MLTELAAVYLTPINKNKIYTRNREPETSCRCPKSQLIGNQNPLNEPATGHPAAPAALARWVAQLALLPLPAARTFKGHY